MKHQITEFEESWATRIAVVSINGEPYRITSDELNELMKDLKLDSVHDLKGIELTTAQAQYINTPRQYYSIYDVYDVEYN